MKRFATLVAISLLFGAGAAQAASKSFDPTICKTLGVDPHASQPDAPQPFGAKQCHVGAVTTDGVTYPIPDPACTPGAGDPTTPVSVLTHAGYSTACVRDLDTSAAKKATRYGDYSVAKVGSGTSAAQLCELDHLVPLELGGADSLDNIWPQCGKGEGVGETRYFKQKDMVENYLAAGIRANGIDQAEAQRRIAQDWTQFLAAARRNCKSTTSCKWGQ